MLKIVKILRETPLTVVLDLKRSPCERTKMKRLKRKNMDFIFQMFAEMFDITDTQDVNEPAEECLLEDQEVELQPVNIFQYVDFH